MRRGFLRCSAWGRFAAGFAMAIVILVARPEAATSEGYRHLSLEGRFVKWPQNAPHVPVHLTFALATRASVDEQAINCRRVGPVDDLLERSGLGVADFQLALDVALRRWEAAANLVFVRTDDEDAADILIGSQIDPDGIAFANLTLSETRVGPYELIERSRLCLNPFRRWKIGFDGNLEVFDLVYTLTHEIGHVVGLDHAPGRDHVMSLRYHETRSRLSAGDVLGVRRLYGRPSGDGPRRWAVSTRLGAAR